MQTTGNLCKIFKFIYCYGLNVCMLPKFICWNPRPQCSGVRSWGLWEIIRIIWGCESVAFMNGINAFIRVTGERASCLCSLQWEDTTRGQQSTTWKRVLTRIGPGWHPDLRLSASRTIRNTFLLFIGNLIQTKNSSCKSKLLKAVHANIFLALSIIAQEYKKIKCP